MGDEASDDDTGRDQNAGSLHLESSFSMRGVKLELQVDMRSWYTSFDPYLQTDCSYEGRVLAWGPGFAEGVCLLSWKEQWEDIMSTAPDWWGPSREHFRHSRNDKALATLASILFPKMVRARFKCRGQSVVSNTDVMQFLWRALSGPFLLLSAPGLVGGDIDDGLVHLLLRGSFLRCAADNIHELDEQCDPQLQLFTATPYGSRDTDSMGKYDEDLDLGLAEERNLHKRMRDEFPGYFKCSPELDEIFREAMDRTLGNLRD